MTGHHFHFHRHYLKIAFEMRRFAYCDKREKGKKIEASKCLQLISQMCLPASPQQGVARINQSICKSNENIFLDFETTRIEKFSSPALITDQFHPIRSPKDSSFKGHRSFNVFATNATDNLTLSETKSIVWRER